MKNNQFIFSINIYTIYKVHMAIVILLIYIILDQICFLSNLKETITNKYYLSFLLSFILYKFLIHIVLLMVIR